MISIIPELEVLKAFTDMNIISPASQVRISAFNEANILIGYSFVEIVIEGKMYERLLPRLKDDHKKIFEEVYDIDNSATNVPAYNHKQAIQFIIDKRKLPVTKRRIIIITNNMQEYSCYAQEPRVKVLSPTDFLSKVEKFNEIKNAYEDVYSAMITAFFF